MVSAVLTCPLTPALSPKSGERGSYGRLRGASGWVRGLLSVGFFRSVSIVGASALVLTLSIVDVVNGQAIGRLFSTPQERAALNEARREYEFGRQPVEVEEEVEVERLSVNGIVLRSSGNNAAWINDSPILEGDATREGIRVEASREGGGSVRIVLPNRRDTFRLKPGQKIDVVRGDVLDVYEPEPPWTEEVLPQHSEGFQPNRSRGASSPQLVLPPGW